jgi:carbonic anhydrase
MIVTCVFPSPEALLTDWVIRKVHFHKPAEHVVVRHANDDDFFAPFECHLVHSLTGDVKGRGPKLVVGVFFAITQKAPKGARRRDTVYGLNEKIRAAAASAAVRDVCAILHPQDINPRDFLPDERTLGRFYRDEGSSTSEPFSEDVSWYVMQAESQFLEGNVDQIELCAEQEARPVDSLDRRFVLRSF